MLEQSSDSTAWQVPLALGLPGSADTAPGRPSTPPRRVLHLINGEHYAGAERVQDLLALALPAQGYEVGFATLKPGAFAGQRRAQQTPLAEFPMRWRADLGPIARIARCVREQGYDLIHSHTPRTALIARLAAWQAGVPWVHHLHSPALADTAQPWRNLRNAALERWCLRGAARLIAVSGSLGEYAVRQRLSKQPVAVVRNGVPALGLLPSRPLPQGDWTLGVVALFRPRKGLEVLLAALARLRRAGRPVRLRAIGAFETPEYHQAMLAEVQRLGLGDAIDWVGFTRDVGSELARLDTLVLPSLFGEGLPMVVLEAMAAGVPVVATRVEGVPEAIVDRSEGLLVPANHVDALADALEQLLSGQVSWSDLRARAHARHAAEFSEVAMARHVAEVYDQVLGVASPRAGG